MHTEIQDITGLTEKFLDLIGPDGFTQHALNDRYAEVCAEARTVWASAFFSERSGAALNRYFDFQFRLSCHLLEGCASKEPAFGDLHIQAASLLDHLLDYYSGHLSVTLDLPLAYLQNCLKKLRAGYTSISGMLAKQPIHSLLKTCIQDYLNHVFDNDHIQMTTGEFCYLRRFVDAVRLALECHEANERSPMLENVLIKLNFNHLLFFQYLRNGYQAAAETQSTGTHINYFRDLLHTMPEDDQNGSPRFNPMWASLFTMIRGWFREEILITEAKLAETASSPCLSPTKIVLNLPVAHLACLIKVLYEVGFYATTNLTDIFKAAACHYSSKRKAAFSQGNISKEYYTVSQQTAARVLELLQRMITHLKLVYFPVMAAISITILYW